MGFVARMAYSCNTFSTTSIPSIGSMAQIFFGMYSVPKNGAFRKFLKEKILRPKSPSGDKYPWIIQRLKTDILKNDEGTRKPHPGRSLHAASPQARRRDHRPRLPEPPGRLRPHPDAPRRRHAEGHR